MSSNCSEDFGFIKLNPEMARQLGLPSDGTLLLPVRGEALVRSVSTGGVSLTEMTDGVLQYIELFPDKYAMYTQVLAKLAVQAAIVAGNNNDHKTANRYFAVAMNASPRDVVIRANLAKSYLVLQQHDMALKHYKTVLQTPGIEFMDFVWYDAAALYAREGNLTEAKHLVDEFVKRMPHRAEGKVLLDAIDGMLRKDAHRDEPATAPIVSYHALFYRAADLAKSGAKEEALRLFRQAEQLYRRKGDNDGLSLALNEQALILAGRGDTEMAIGLMHEDQRISRECGNFEGVARSMANEASVLALKMQHPMQALRVAEQALAIAREHDLPQLVGQIAKVQIAIRQSR